VDGIVKILKEKGGEAKASTVIRSFELLHNKTLRCLASFVSDCRKVGADIRYNKADDTLTLVQEPQYERPRQRNINSLDAAVNHLTEWLNRKRKGAPEVEAIRRVLEFVVANADITPYEPPEYHSPPPRQKLVSYQLFD
jgi:hypothetical protein